MADFCRGNFLDRYYTENHTSMNTRDLIETSIREGGRLTRLRWPLVVLLYAVNLVIALVMAIPIYRGTVRHLGGTGFGADLIESFDLILWSELGEKLLDTLAGLGWQLLLVLPIYWIWKTAAHVGVIYALHNGAAWPFWRGAGYYTGRGLVIGLIFLPIKIIWLVLSIIIAATVRSFFPGEVGIFWSIAILLPILLVAGLAVLDLFQHYARLALIIRHDPVGKATRAGFSWPFKYVAAWAVYALWFFISLIVGFTTIVLNAKLHVGVSAILLGFLIQQISLLTRAGVTVAWLGSEVNLFERTHISELPLIADAGELPGSS